MKKCFFFIFLIMVFFGCTHLEIKRHVVENTFYSSFLSEIAYTNLYSQDYWRDRVFYAVLFQSLSILRPL